MEKLEEGDMFLWYGLPALAVDNKIALFSNLEGNLKVIELEEAELDDKDTYLYAKQNGLFDCLVNYAGTDDNKTTLVLTLTRCCNSLCRYCFLSANVRGKTMTKEMIYSAIDKAFDLSKGKKLVISFLGGEPTFKFQLLKAGVLYAEQHPLNAEGKELQFGITTNGTFNDEMADFFIQHKFKVSVSLDGTPEIQDFHRPLANGTKPSAIIEKNILKLSKVLPVKTLGTTTNFSVNKMSESVEYFAKLGVKRAFFNPVTERGRGITTDTRLLPPTPDDFVDNLKKAISTGEKLGVDVISFPYMNLTSCPMKYCKGNRLVVNYNGDVSSCVEIQESEHPLFDTFKIGYFKEETQKILINKPLHKCSESQNISEKCKKCPLSFFCGEGCPARNFIGSSNQYEIDNYRCLITKKIMPFILKRVYISTYKKQNERIENDFR